jgi:hypothetical protein
MYNDHLETKQNGLFCNVDIPANVPILEITGTVYAEHNLPDPNHPAILQIGPNIFIGPSGGVDDYINHSCNPNCLVRATGQRALLFSMYTIKAGTELTFDYSTTSTDTLDKWKMDCSCNEFNCRKVISGYQYLDESLKEKYKKLGMVPLFLTNPIFLKRY